MKTTPTGPWQRSVPLVGERYINGLFLFLIFLGFIGLVISAIRMTSGLGYFAGMNDAYTWGVWKNFNVMTLTALGSGGLSVGLAVWVFGRKKLHAVMRVAVLTSFLFYTTGIIAIMVDIGRPWNFWNVLLPWRWNPHSALLEVALCMPAYAFLPLLIENLPPVMEDVHLRGAGWQKKLVHIARPAVEKIFPMMLALAMVLPMMHQSSLGALMLFGGHKVHPLWQTQMLPLLYLIDAIVCGFAFVIFALMTSCLYWRLPLDMEILSELGKWMSYTGIFWVILRSIDIFWRGQFLNAFKPDFYSVLFQVEQSFILVPALILLREKWRSTPTVLLQSTLFLIFGGLLYRFDPTTLAFQPGRHYSYFPSIAEIFIGVGYISLAIAVYSLAVKRFAILPAPAARWNAAVAYVRKQQPESKLTSGALWQTE